MRMMARVSIPTGDGNEAIRKGTLGKTMQKTAERWHPEAMYFTAVDGRRCAYIVFDMADPSDMPSFAEPLFMELGAEIELSPAMSGDDLERGLGRLD